MASVKCPACGLVNFEDAKACRRCRKPLAQPAAGAPPGDPKSGGSRAVLGPVFTQAGFKGWHMVCLADALITVPQGFLRTLSGTMAAASPLFGLAGALFAAKGSKHSTKAKALLAQMPEDHLRADPHNVVYPLAELVSISLKRPKLSSPEIRLERRGQGVMVFGLTMISAFGEISAELQRLYPGLCRSIT
jgi:hypothetical protein